jgi:hypothetical protein
VTEDSKRNQTSALDDDRIGRALADWPPHDAEAARPATAWDAAAALVTTKLATNTAARSMSRLTDDALLAAPFAAEPHEGTATTMTTKRSDPPGQKSTLDDVPGRRPGSIAPPSSAIAREAPQMTQSDQRQRERTSFKDFAKLAATPPPSSVVPNSDGVEPPVSSAWGMAMPDAGSGPASRSGALDPNDSGMVDLKTIATLDPRGAERAKTTPLAASGLFDDESPASQAPHSQAPMSSRASAPPSALGRPSIPSERPPMVVQASAQAESAPLSMQNPASHAPAPLSARAMMGSGAALPKSPKKGAGGILVVLGGVVALAAAAAGGVFYMKTHKAADLAASKPAAAVVAVAPVTAPETTAAAATVATNDTAPAPTENAVDPDPVGAAQKDEEPKVAAKTGARRGGGKVALATKPAAPPTTPAAAAAPKKETKTAAAPTSTTELGKAMQQAAGPADAVAVEEKPTGPQFAPGSVPQKPANGTVMGAIGAVLPNARACLGPDDPVSRATITFQSTGSVQSVSVSGGAAGKPAEACVKTALSKAKVPPFAEATFTTAVTVRP